LRTKIRDCSYLEARTAQVTSTTLDLRLQCARRVESMIP
jgi:hypothetical protein